ncbi:hypothetical protein ES708_12192 [subsurface metagenome]
MNLTQAIEILKDLPVGGQQISLQDRLDACALGMEALKRLQEARKKCLFPSFSLLPGETERRDDE